MKIDVPQKPEFQKGWNKDSQGIPSRQNHTAGNVSQIVALLYEFIRITAWATGRGGTNRKEGAGPEGSGIPGSQTPAKEGRHPPAARSQHPVQLLMLPKST